MVNPKKIDSINAEVSKGKTIRNGCLIDNSGSDETEMSVQSSSSSSSAVPSNAIRCHKWKKDTLMDAN